VGLKRAFPPPPRFPRFWVQLGFTLSSPLRLLFFGTGRANRAGIIRLSRMFRFWLSNPVFFLTPPTLVLLPILTAREFHSPLSCFSAFVCYIWHSIYQPAPVVSPDLRFEGFFPSSFAFASFADGPQPRLLRCLALAALIHFSVGGLGLRLFCHI